MSGADLSHHMDQVRAMNDAFRTTFLGGFIDPSDGVLALDRPARRELLSLVREYDDFDNGDDEHDAGIVQFDGEPYAWTILYFGPDMNCASIDPADAEETRRVLRIFKEAELH